MSTVCIRAILPAMDAVPHIAALYVYPVKSCAGIALDAAQLLPTGIANDREWMVTDPVGHFLTQRDAPRMALVRTALDATALTLRAGDTSLELPTDHEGPLREVVVWRSRVPAFDAGEPVAQMLSAFLGRPARLVRFDRRHRRLSNPDWTGAQQAPNFFSDGFPVLVASLASLEDLNRRLAMPLPMDRFRPNVVLGGVGAWAEDALGDIGAGDVKLRIVKPCTRCVITTTDQARGERDGEEPMRTLKTFRHDAALRGVTFGQNAIVLQGGTLRVGLRLT
jgi:uncharacterized protein